MTVRVRQPAGRKAGEVKGTRERHPSLKKFRPAGAASKSLYDPSEQSQARQQGSECLDRQREQV